jgi:hypothetical protein
LQPNAIISGFPETTKKKSDFLKKSDFSRQPNTPAVDTFQFAKNPA